MKYVIMALILVGCTGPRGDSGSQGTPGLQGPAGNTGPAGATGPQGATGPSGADGTSIVWVQFCQGTTTYPADFQEGGLCISGNIYGVYSANNGFLTLLPPGAYNSNAIGSSCNFTIQANCVIQN